MNETQTITEAMIGLCPRCGWMKFNPDCPDCQEMREQRPLMGTGIEGFDM